jgi:hypothetical protein
MSKTDFDHMTKIKGRLMSFNNFLSISKDRDVSLNFVRRALPNSDMVGILFVMIIDPTKSKTSFASIVDVSYYQDGENEVLVSMNTVFRISEIKPMAQNHRRFPCFPVRHVKFFGSFQCLKTFGRGRSRHGDFPARNTASMFRMFLQPLPVGVIQDAPECGRNSTVPTDFSRVWRRKTSTWAA